MSSTPSVADATEPRELPEENKNVTGEAVISHNRHSFATDDDGGDSRKTELHEYGDDLAPLDLVYELGHISTRRNPARPLTLSLSTQDTYYTDLVASRCRGDNLPNIYARKHYPRATSSRHEPIGSTVLYDSIDRDDVITRRPGQTVRWRHSQHEEAERHSVDTFPGTDQTRVHRDARDRHNIGGAIEQSPRST